MFALSKKISEKNYLIFSCVISYVLLAFTSLLKAKLLKSIQDSVLTTSAISIVIGTFVVFLIVILSQRTWFKQLTIKILHKTINEDIWRDVFDLKNGSNLKVYLKDKDYYVIGHLKNYEEKENDSWIALKAFAKFDIETNNNYRNEPSYLDKDNIYITMRFSDIDHIEIF